MLAVLRLIFWEIWGVLTQVVCTWRSGQSRTGEVSTAKSPNREAELCQTIYKEKTLILRFFFTFQDVVQRASQAGPTR